VKFLGRAGKGGDCGFVFRFGFYARGGRGTFLCGEKAPFEAPRAGGGGGGGRWSGEGAVRRKRGARPEWELGRLGLPLGGVSRARKLKEGGGGNQPPGWGAAKGEFSPGGYFCGRGRVGRARNLSLFFLFLLPPPPVWFCLVGGRRGFLTGRVHLPIRHRGISGAGSRRGLPGGFRGPCGYAPLGFHAKKLNFGLCHRFFPAGGGGGTASRPSGVASGLRGGAPALGTGGGPPPGNPRA